MTRYRVQWMRPHRAGTDVPQRYRHADFDHEADALAFERHLRAKGRSLVCTYRVTVEVAA